MTWRVLALWLSIIAPAWAQPFHAGVIRLGGDVDALIWYPSDTAEGAWRVNDFELPARHDAPFSAGRFPIILLSHGGGLTGGSPLILGGLSAALAREGFIVVAPFHGNVALRVRPRQAAAALRAALIDPGIARHADASRIGALGFSLGGAVALILAGAQPDFPHYAAYCRQTPDDVMACDHGPGGGSGHGAAIPTNQAGAALPIKALVLLDPLGALFQAGGLATITMPVLLVRPDGSALRAAGNALALAASLPAAPETLSVPGSHFIFTDRCPAPFLPIDAERCGNPPGIDRDAVQLALWPAIAQFFHDRL